MSINGYDIAQICKNGHVNSSTAGSSPEFQSKYCEKCGAETIMKCPECSTPIRGWYHVPGVIDFVSKYNRPSYCHNCGVPYPWTSRKLEAAAEFAKETNVLSTEELDQFSKDIETLSKETPDAEIAAFRFKKVIAKIGEQGGGIIKNILTDILSETIKKLIIS